MEKNKLYKRMFFDLGLGILVLLTFIFLVLGIGVDFLVEEDNVIEDSYSKELNTYYLQSMFGICFVGLLFVVYMLFQGITEKINIFRIIAGLGMFLCIDFILVILYQQPMNVFMMFCLVVLMIYLLFYYKSELKNGDV